MPAQRLKWVLPQSKGIESLVVQDDVSKDPLGDDEVAVDMYAASLNYRDIVIAKVLYLHVAIEGPGCLRT